MNKKVNDVIDDKLIDNSDQVLDETTEKKQTVDFETYDRAMNTIGKKNNRLKELEEELSRYKKIEAEKEEKLLEEQGKFKERLELEQRKRLEVEQKFTSLEERHYGTMKEVALRRSLPKLISDPDIDAIISLKAKNIILDDDGFPIKESVEEIAGELKSKTFLFGQSQKKNLPADAPQESKTLTYDEWLKLPTNERKLRFKEMKNADK